MASQEPHDSDYHAPSEDEESQSEPEPEPLEEDEIQMIRHEAQEQDAQGWPDLSQIEPILSESQDLSESRKKATRSLYNAFLQDQKGEGILQRSKTDIWRVFVLTKHIPNLPKVRGKKIRAMVEKCIELCPEKKKRSADKKSSQSSGSSTPLPETSNSASILGADIVSNVAVPSTSSTAEKQPDVTDAGTSKKQDVNEGMSKKRKAVFDVAETKKKKKEEKEKEDKEKGEKEKGAKDDEDDFFDPKKFNKFGILGHPGIIPRRAEKTPIDRQLDKWCAIDKDTKMAAFEKIWINDKSTNKQHVLKLLRRYKKKGSEEGSTYTFDIPLENIDIMIEQLQELQKRYERKNPGWFAEAHARRQAVIDELLTKGSTIEPAIVDSDSD